MFCHKCGNKSLEESAFCNKCGAKIISEDNVRQSVPEPNISAPQVPVEPKAQQAAVSTSAPAPELSQNNAEMTKEEAYELLKNNSSRCPKIKKVFLDKQGLLTLKGKLCNHNISIVTGKATVSSSYKWSSPVWIISYVIFILSIALLNEAADEFDWPGFLPWLLWGGLLVLDFFVMSLIAKPERIQVASFVSETLNVEIN